MIATTALLACAAPAAAQDSGGASADPGATATPVPAATATATPATSTTADATTSTVKTLKVGARGKLVKQLQRRLKLRADGVYGRQTASAVERYQRRKGLKATGAAGPDTLVALGLVAKPTVARPASDPTTVLTAIAICESGGDPTAVSRSGTYRGKYQFDRATWKAMGGAGDPAEAEEAEQDARALTLYTARGITPWPVCGPKAVAGEVDTTAAPVSAGS